MIERKEKKQQRNPMKGVEANSVRSVTVNDENCCIHFN